MEREDARKKILSGMIWKFSERVLNQLISFILSIILARILIPEDYGVVALVNIFVVISSVFVTSGFSTSLIQKKDANETDFSSIFYCSLVVSVIVYMILFIAAPFIAKFYGNSSLTLIVRVFSLQLIFMSYSSVQNAYVSKKMLFKKVFWSSNVGNLSSGVIGIIMALNGFGVWALISQGFVSTIVNILVLNIIVGWHPKLVFSLNSARDLMRYGWKILVADLSGTFFDQLRSLLIGKIYTTADLAYYNRGKSFSDLVYLNVQSTISSVLFPAMSNENDNMEKIKSMVRRSMKVSSYILFPIMVGLAIIAKPLIELLLTNKWDACVPFMQIMCISSALAMIGNTNLQAMKAIGQSGCILRLEIIKKPIYFLLLVLSIRISVFALAFSMLIYTVIANVINMRPNKKFINYGYKEQIEDIFPAFMLTFLMFCILIAVGCLKIPNIIMIVLQVVLGIIVYIILSILFKVESYVYLKTIIFEICGRKMKKGDV